MLNVVNQSVCNQSKWNMAKTTCFMHLCMCKQQECVQDYRLLPAMHIVNFSVMADGMLLLADKSRL